MEIRGRLIQVLNLQQGTSQAGRAWKKQDYVIETFDAYPRKVCFNLFGERVDQFASMMVPDADLMVSFDLESREFNGRWYTDVRAWKIEDGPTAAARMVGAPTGGAPAFGAPAAAPAEPFQVGFAGQAPAQPSPAVPQFDTAPTAPAGEPSSTDDLPF